MPHSRSPAKALIRRERAVERNYLQWVPTGAKWVLASTSIAPAAKVVVRSMAVHAAHDVLSGCAHHHARVSTNSARPSLSDAEARAAQSLHRAANRAKHSVGATPLFTGCPSWVDLAGDAAVSWADYSAEASTDDCDDLVLENAPPTPTECRHLEDPVLAIPQTHVPFSLTDLVVALASALANLSATLCARLSAPVSPPKVTIRLSELIAIPAAPAQVAAAVGSSFSASSALPARVTAQRPCEKAGSEVGDGPAPPEWVHDQESHELNDDHSTPPDWDLEQAMLESEASPDVFFE